jgi:hypothetical protein
MSFLLLPSLTEVASPNIGGRASKTANKLFEPTRTRLNNDAARLPCGATNFRFG